MTNQSINWLKIRSVLICFKYLNKNMLRTLENYICFSWSRCGFKQHTSVLFFQTREPWEQCAGLLVSVPSFPISTAVI